MDGLLLTSKMSYCKILQSWEAAKLYIEILKSPRNLNGSLAALLPSCLSNFKVIEHI